MIPKTYNPSSIRDQVSLCFLLSRFDIMKRSVSARLSGYCLLKTSGGAVIRRKAVWTWELDPYADNSIFDIHFLRCVYRRMFAERLSSPFSVFSSL